MTRRQTTVMFIFLCGMLLAASTPSYAKPPMPSVPNYLKPIQVFPQQPSSEAAARANIAAARAQAAAEARGEVTSSALAASVNNSTSTYTLYVNCPNSPASKTYGTIQDAVAVALPHTTIKVCPGTYVTGGASTGILVTTSWIKIEGVLTHAGDETLNCTSGPNPTDGSYGFWLEGQGDEVEYMTVSDCDFGVYIGFNPETKGSKVTHDYFNDDYNGVDVFDGVDITISDSHFQTNFYPIFTKYDAKDCISGNTIEGDGNFDDDGIYVEYGVSAKIESNTVNGSEFGLEMDLYNALAWVESNHFDGNEVGVYLGADLTATTVGDNSGNTFEKNYASGNFLVGFLLDDTEGADAIPDSGANKFLKNQAYGNGAYDYFDDTYGYLGNEADTNAGTADYYKGNKGGSAVPGAIFFQ